ncbi:hypothetical protein Bca52824_017365 [Brassica carinata]|uniref:Uncharacterized protein n=1 Tax=Brassica carinata TaxID=52824 RepID=A0A8X8AXD1_BRACI|nr:hypothetical protein Bca52824_017365 [Brassica carinata]
MMDFRDLSFLVAGSNRIQGFGVSRGPIGGVSGDLIEQNAQMFNQVSSNFSAFQIHDNVNPFKPNSWYHLNFFIQLQHTTTLSKIS